MEKILVPATVILIILAALCVFVPAIQKILPAEPAVALSHADDKHGPDAQEVRDAVSRTVIIMAANEATARLAKVCMLNDGTYGIQIVEKDANGNEVEVTCFKKEKLSTIEKVIRYLFNRGYEQ